MSTFGKYIPHYREILRLGGPLFLGQLGSIAVGFADNIMVGHYSTGALASASFVNNFFNVAVFCCVGFGYGLTPLIGALFSRGKDYDIGHYARIALRVNVIFTVVISAVMLMIYFCLGSMGQPPELMPLIRPYYLIVLAGMIPVSVLTVFSQWCFAIGNTATPTWIILGANVLNIIGNYMLIFGNFGAPELGLFGAGVSTLASRVISMVAMAAYMLLRRDYRRYRDGFADRRNGGISRKVLLTGFPVSMQMTFETAAFSGSAIMAGWIDAISLAALQIVVISGMFGFCIYYSIAGAMAIDVSHAAGNADNAAMRRSAWAGYHIVIVAMIAACCLFIFGGSNIMGLFTDDAAVLSLAVTLIFPLVLYQLGDATQITFANALRGTSRVMPMLYIAFVCYVVVGLPSTYLLAFVLNLKLYGIVLSFSVSLYLAATLYLTNFLKSTKSRNCSAYEIEINCAYIARHRRYCLSCRFVWHIPAV